MKRIFAKTIVTLLLITFFVSTVYAANVFTENFDGLTDGTDITTDNTNFDYVRIGSGGGTITAEQAASGEMHLRLGGSSSTSLNGVGVQDSLGGMTITTLNFRWKPEDTAGDLFIGMGSGSMFTGNGIFVTDQLMWGIQSNNGILQYRTTIWNDVGTTLTSGTNYEFHVVANRSGSTVTYGGNSVSNATMDLFIDGSLVGDDLPITNNQNADGFRIYQVNGSHYSAIDSITIDNTALDPFTPTAITLRSLTATSAQSPWPTPTLLASVGIVLGGTIILWRRRREH